MHQNFSTDNSLLLVNRGVSKKLIENNCNNTGDTYGYKNENWKY